MVKGKQENLEERPWLNNYESAEHLSTFDFWTL